VTSAFADYGARVLISRIFKPNYTRHFGSSNV
jgi:hypothetical protein